MMNWPPRIDAVINSLRIGILAFDETGQTEFLNNAASKILGLSSTLAKTRPIAEYLGPQHPLVPIIRDSLEHGSDVSIRDLAIADRIHSRVQRVNVTAAPIYDGDQLRGIVVTLDDRTIGSELEELMNQRTRSELFAQLAAGVAHEIRNPLGGIRGAAQLLSGKLEDPDLQRYPDLIRAETDRIRRLLDDLAELTHGGDLRPASANIYEILDAVLELQSRSSEWGSIEINREFDPSLPELECDRDRLTQIFINLIRNAVQAMEFKGTLTVRTRIESSFHMTPEAATPTQMIRIDIEDTGPGIPEEDMPYIFTPFFTRRQQGTGLGLAIAQHWTVRHGGQLIARRLNEGGMQMRVLLPLRRTK